MGSTSGGSPADRSSMTRANGDHAANLLTARRSGRNAASNPSWGQAPFTWLGDVAPASSNKNEQGATEQNGSSSPRDPETATSGSEDGGKRQRSEHPVAGNVRNLSAKRKRMDTRSYVSLFKPPGQTELPDVAAKSVKQSSAPADTNKEPPKVPAEETTEARRKRRKMSEFSGLSSRKVSVVSKDDLLPENSAPFGAAVQPLDDTRQALGVENMTSTPKSLHFQLKRKLSKLIKVLQLPDNVCSLAEHFFGYILRNHQVVLEPKGILHAFNIALCWRAASRLKYNKLNRRESLALAADCLKYEYNEELAVFFYGKLRTLMKNFQAAERSNRIQNNKTSSQESSSTNLKNDDLLPNQAMDLHGNFTEGAPQESRSGAELMVSDGQELLSAPEAHIDEHLSSEESPSIMVKKRIDLIYNILSLRKKNIHEKQQAEILELETRRKNEVIKLKDVCNLVLQHIRRGHIDEETRNDQIKLTTQWFAMLMCAFLEHMKLQHKKLEALQSNAWFQEGQIKEKVNQELMSGKLDEPADRCVAPPCYNFVIEEFIHFKKHIDTSHVDKIVASGCDQSLDDRSRMDITLVQNTHPSEVMSCAVRSELAEAESGKVAASEYGTHGNVSSMPSQQSPDAPSRHPPVVAESMCMLGRQVDQNPRADMQRSTSLLGAPPQKMHQDDTGQTACLPDRATHLSEEGESEYPTNATHSLTALTLSREVEAENSQGETEYPACTTHRLTALPLSRELETENSQAGMRGQQSTDLHSQQSLGASCHPPEQAEPAGVRGMVAADDLQPSTLMLDQTAEAEQASTSVAGAAHDLQAEMQPSTTTKGVQFESTDITGMPVSHSTISQQNLEPSRDTHAGVPEGSVGMLAAHVLQSRMQPSSSGQHQPEEAESTGILGTALADDLQRSTSILDQSADTGGESMFGTTAARDLQHEVQQSTATQDVPVERAGLSGRPVTPSTIVVQGVEPSGDPHTERAGTMGMVAAPDLQPEIQQSSSTQNPEDAQGAGMSGAIAAQDLQPEMQPSTSAQHIPPARAHPDERIQISLQSDTASSPEQLTQLFSLAPAAFNHLMYSYEPLRNEVAKLNYCKTLLDKSHEQKKSLLQTQYNQEMEKLNRKYESLHQKEDSTYHQKTTELDGIYRKVFMQQSLAENFRDKLTQSYAAQERSASPTIGQVPQSSQQAPARTSGVQTAASPVASSLATQPSVLASSHATGPFLEPSRVARPSVSEAIQMQSTLPGNLYRATSSPLTSMPLRGAAGAQSHGLAPHPQHLRLPPPYATVRRDQQQHPVTSPGITSLRQAASGIMASSSPLAGLPLTSMASSSVNQAVPSASNPYPDLPVSSLLPGSVTDFTANFVPSFGINPIPMATQQASNPSPNAAAGIWHAGGHIAGVNQPLPDSFQQRWYTAMAGAVLTSVASSSVQQTMTSNPHPAVAGCATSPVFMATPHGSSPNPAFNNNSGPLNAAAGTSHAGVHIAGASQSVPDSALLNAWLAGRTGPTVEPAGTGAQRGSSEEVVCISDDE